MQEANKQTNKKKKKLNKNRKKRRKINKYIYVYMYVYLYLSTHFMYVQGPLSENTATLHGLVFPISSKGSFI